MFFNEKKLMSLMTFIFSLIFLGVYLIEKKEKNSNIFLLESVVFLILSIIFTLFYKNSQNPEYIPFSEPKFYEEV